MYEKGRDLAAAFVRKQMSRRELIQPQASSASAPPQQLLLNQAQTRPWPPISTG